MSMSPSTRRTLWWVLTAVLAVALLGTATVAAFQTVRLVASHTAEPPADSAGARQEVLDFAKDTTVKLLSYQPETAEQQLTEAIELTGGEFRSGFEELVRDIVIPAAKEQNISAEVTVPAVGIEELTEDAASVIVFVNQTVTVGSAEPTTTPSSVRMKLDKSDDGSWLVTEFGPP